MFITPKLKHLPLAVIALVSLAGCYNFYQARRGFDGKIQSQQSLDSLKSNNRYFILRSGDDAWHMSQIKLNEENKMISCMLDTLTYFHKLHLSNGYKGNMRYKKGKPEHISVLNEVHFFIRDEQEITTGAFTLPLDKVVKVEVLEKDRKRTTNSYVLGAIGYTVGTIALVGIIIAATKSSCPFVSAYDGHDFLLQGEIYGGAIYPQLARHDYMPLKMAPLQDGTLQIKISNELKERQYTDMADLWVISHEKDQKVMVDQNGSLYSIANPESPTSAMLNGNTNVLAAIEKPNDYELMYMSDSSRKNASNELALRFNKPVNTSQAKLVLTLKNSYWLDLLYGELAKGFGSYYMTYISNQRNKPAAELLAWVKQQQIPLTVTLKTKTGRVEIQNITTVGPLATREIVVPVDLTDTDDGPVEISLSSGFMFWEIDYVAMDFSSNDNFVLQKLSPKKAVDETGKNVLAPLLKEDGEYLDQPETGDVATIVYKPNDLSSTKAHTYILHTRGYYEHVREFNNKPNVAFLNQFKKPDAFPMYGMRLYQQVSAQSLQSISSKN